MMGNSIHDGAGWPPGATDDPKDVELSRLRARLSSLEQSLHAEREKREWAEAQRDKALSDAKVATRAREAAEKRLAEFQGIAPNGRCESCGQVRVTVTSRDGSSWLDCCPSCLSAEEWKEAQRADKAEAKLAESEAGAAAMRRALEDAHEQACRYGCASKWRTADGEESRHTETCRRTREALAHPAGRGILEELERKTKALEEIARVKRGGIEMCDPDEEWIRFWSDRVAKYESIARAALAPAKEGTP